MQQQYRKKYHERWGNSVGSKAVFGFLTKGQKDKVIKHFNLEGENDLFNRLATTYDKQVADFAGRLVGHNNVYSQCPKIKEDKTGLIGKEWTCFDISKPTEFNKKSKNLGNRLRSRR